MVFVWLWEVAVMLGLSFFKAADKVLKRYTKRVNDMTDFNQVKTLLSTLPIRDFGL